MKVIKIMLLLATPFMLVGCGQCQRNVAVITGHSKICVDGVSYLQFPSGVTVEYQTDGTIKLCK